MYDAFSKIIRKQSKKKHVKKSVYHKRQTENETAYHNIYADATTDIRAGNERNETIERDEGGGRQ